MTEKKETGKESADNIKAELNAVLMLNRKRKAALEKISNSILKEKDKKQNKPKNK